MEGVMWSTKLLPSGDKWLVELRLDLEVVATLSLDEWADLSATKVIADSHSEGTQQHQRPAPLQTEVPATRLG